MNLLYVLTILFLMSLALTLVGNAIIFQINYLKEMKIAQRSINRITDGKKKSMDAAEKLMREAFKDYVPMNLFSLRVVMSIAVLAFFILYVYTGQ
jgi:uncharacterized membrane protein